MAETGLDLRKATSIRDYLYKPDIKKQLEMALPKFMNADRFLRVFYTAMLRNPALLECSTQSMLSAMIECAQLGLEPVMGKAALVPYKGQMQFQPMYRGLIDIARRTGNIIISGHNVHENDQFDIEYGDNERIFHKPVYVNRGEVIGAYTVWNHENGMKSRLFMPIEDIHAIRERSQAWRRAKANSKDFGAQQTPWVTDAGEMNIKTVIKRHAKLQPCSIEMDLAVGKDDYVEFGAAAPSSFMDFKAAPALTSTGAQEPVPLSFDDTVSLMVPENTDMGALQEFIEQSADSINLTVEDFKAKVMVERDFQGFWKAFKSSQDQEKTLFETLKYAKGHFVKLVKKNLDGIRDMLPDEVDYLKKKWAVQTKEPWPFDNQPLVQNVQNLSMEDAQFVSDVENYRQELNPDAWNVLANFFGIVVKPVTTISLEMRPKFLEQCKKQLDKQNL